MQVTQTSDYYPFGLGINPLAYSKSVSHQNNYKYNGKELQSEFGLNWLDRDGMAPSIGGETSECGCPNPPCDFPMVGLGLTIGGGKTTISLAGSMVSENESGGKASATLTAQYTLGSGRIQLNGKVNLNQESNGKVYGFTIKGSATKGKDPGISPVKLSAETNVEQKRPSDPGISDEANEQQEKIKDTNQRMNDMTQTGDDKKNKPNDFKVEIPSEKKESNKNEQKQQEEKNGGN